MGFLILSSSFLTWLPDSVITHELYDQSLNWESFTIQIEPVKKHEVPPKVVLVEIPVLATRQAMFVLLYPALLYNCHCGETVRYVNMFDRSMYYYCFLCCVHSLPSISDGIERWQILSGCVPLAVLCVWSSFRFFVLRYARRMAALAPATANWMPWEVIPLLQRRSGVFCTYIRSHQMFAASPRRHSKLERKDSQEEKGNTTRIIDSIQEWCSHGLPGEHLFAKPAEVMAEARERLRMTLSPWQHLLIQNRHCTFFILFHWREKDTRSCLFFVSMSCERNFVMPARPYPYRVL